VAGPPVAFPEDPKDIMMTTKAIYDGLKGDELDFQTIGRGNGGFVDVRDVARQFVWQAENPEKSNGERFLAVGGFTNAQAILDILREAYPERKDIIQVGNPGQGYMKDFSYPEGGMRTDNSKVPKITGFSWTPYKKTVLDAAKAFERYL
jgi:nucleoside-diphosphate-sugar epimerase